MENEQEEEKEPTSPFHEETASGAAPEASYFQDIHISSLDSSETFMVSRFLSCVFLVLCGL